MPIDLACPCGKQFHIDESLAGRRITCKTCKRSLVVPKPAVLEEDIALAPADEPEEVALEPLEEEIDEVEVIGDDGEVESPAYGLNAEDAQLEGRLRGGPDGSSVAAGELGVFKISRELGPITFLTFAADNRHALAVLHEIIGVLHVKNGEVLYRFKKHADPVTCAAFSPDGRMALSGDAGGRMCLWDTQSGEEIDWLPRHDARVGAVAFSPCGRYAVSAGDDGAFLLWDVNSGDELDQLSEESSGHVNSLTFSADGRLILTAGSGGKVRLWDLKARRPIGRFHGANGTLPTVAFTRDGGVVAARCAKMTRSGLAVWQWDLRTGKPVACFEHPGTPEAYTSCVTLTPDGVRLVTAGATIDKRSGLGHLGPTGSTGVPLLDLLSAGAHVYMAVQGDNIHKIRGGHAVLVWNVTTGQIVQRYETGGKAITSVAVSPDGRLALTGSKDSMVRAWGLPE